MKLLCVCVGGFSAMVEGESSQRPTSIFIKTYQSKQTIDADEWQLKK